MPGRTFAGWATRKVLPAILVGPPSTRAARMAVRACPATRKAMKPPPATAMARAGCPPNAMCRFAPAGFGTRENALVKSSDELLDLYFKSVGRGAHLLLNVPPDRRGLLHENDLASLSAFGQRMRGIFRENIAARATATA